LYQQKPPHQNNLNVHHFESHVEGLGAQHDVTVHKKRKFQDDNIAKCKTVRVVAVQTERPEILKEE